jgi:hypothetical protein
MTVSKLREVVQYLKLSYTKQVPEREFFRAIMEKIGASDRSRRHAAEAMHTMGFMRPLGNGIWEFAGEYAPIKSEPLPVLPTVPPAEPSPGAPGDDEELEKREVPQA